MNLQAVFCPNPGCRDKYVKGKGNIISHGQKRPRCKCTSCGRTFAYTRGTPFFGLRSEVSEIVCVVTLVAYGCPVAAIVAAFERDERTIAHWLQRCGHHAEVFHHQHMQPLDLQQVQVDELWLHIHKQVMWLAMAVVCGSVPCAVRDATNNWHVRSSPVSTIGHNNCRWSLPLTAGAPTPKPVPICSANPFSPVGSVAHANNPGHVSIWFNW